jgi:hypothetical protein
MYFYGKEIDIEQRQIRRKAETQSHGSKSPDIRRYDSRVAPCRGLFFFYFKSEGVFYNEEAVAY